MTSTLRLAVAAGILLLLNACGTPAVPIGTNEPQNRAASASRARMYFLWPAHIQTAINTIWIKVDGTQVGSLEPRSYFFVDRPPGRHTIALVGAQEMESDAEVDMRAGPQYFLIAPVNMQQGLVQQMLQDRMMGTQGRALAMRKRDANLLLYAVEPQEGAAVVAKLRHIRGRVEQRTWQNETAPTVID
jgi:hypothetical protein